MQPLLSILLLSTLSASAQTPTFYQHVLPILQVHCQSCHRPGEIGPMPLLDYSSTRPWAKSIRQSVATRKMPPWFADPHVGSFSNNRALPPNELDTILKWVDAGAPAGDPKLAPPPVHWTGGWRIPSPDLVVSMPRPFEIPAAGKVDYQYVVVPLNLTGDRWVQMVEARPSAQSRASVHHAVIFARPPDSNWLRGEAEPGVPFVPPRTRPDGRQRDDIGGMGNEILTTYSPGNEADVWKPGHAKLLRAGTDLVFQMHYTPSGKPVADQTSVGLVFATTPPTGRVMTVPLMNKKFVIPPGASNHLVSASFPVLNDATLLSFFPHMHLRGKAFEYRLRTPGGATQPLLKVSAYNFNWQLTYRLAHPLKLEPGSRIEGSAWYDNSPNNPFNPDPSAEVRWGEQSDQEMMIGFFDVLIDARLNLRSWLRGVKPPAE